MPKPLKIITVPDPILRQKSQPVELTDKVKKLIKRMKATLYDDKRKELIGIGLAAVQVGYPWRIFLATPSYKKPLPFKVFINPVITNKSKEMVEAVPELEFKYEGCLSIPNIYGLVSRHKWVEVKYQTIEDNRLIDKQERFEGLISTIIQHEYDHLEGILFVDRVISNGKTLYELKEVKGEQRLVPLNYSLPIFNRPRKIKT